MWLDSKRRLISIARSCINLQPRLTSSFTTIPVIDISSFAQPRSADSKQRQQAATQIHDACKDVGFFYIKNHGVDEACTKGVLSAARQWFQLQDNVKQQLAIGPHSHYRGYQQLGANVTRYDGSFQRDWHEAIDLYYELDPSDCKRLGLQPSPLHGRNQWPRQHPEFEARLREYVTAMTGLGGVVMRAIAAGLGLPSAFFEGALRGDPYWVVRVIHYPSLPAGSGADPVGARDAAQGSEVPRSVQLSCGEHTDYGMLTMVNQEDEVAALQVKNNDGKWITAEPIPGTFVCNIGDMIRIWTNGLYTPTLHRVINLHPTKSRVSIPYFYEPGFETVVEPILGLHGSTAPAKFPGVRYGAHLEQKVLSNFEL